MESIIGSYTDIVDLRFALHFFPLQGRWYYRREAVKDLHSTLIRLLNELTPWEPKLVKAFQRNRYDPFNTIKVH